MLDTGCWILDAGCSSLRAERSNWMGRKGFEVFSAVVKNRFSDESPPASVSKLSASSRRDSSGSKTVIHHYLQPSP